MPQVIAKKLCQQHHYLGTYPGGSLLNFGVFVSGSLLGIVVIGVGGFNIFRLFQDAERHEVACLTRMWLSDQLGRNSESRTLGIILRLLRKHQSRLKALIAYSDPMAGHDGCIYRGAGFLYLGKSSATPQYKLPDGELHRSRTLGHMFGSRSLKHFALHGVSVEVVPQEPKHTYVALIDPSWRSRLRVTVRPYPKRLDIVKEDIP